MLNIWTLAIQFSHHCIEISHNNNKNPTIAATTKCVYIKQQKFLNKCVDERKANKKLGNSILPMTCSE
jgi:hypothetical protein